MGKGIPPLTILDELMIPGNLIHTIMTISDIKAELNVASLNLSWFKAEDGTVTDWLREWDNTNRVAVLMHKDVDDILQDNPDYGTLGLKKTVKVGSGDEEFTNYVIVAYKPADRQY